MLPPQHEWPWEEGFREILHRHTKVTATGATVLALSGLQTLYFF